MRARATPLVARKLAAALAAYSRLDARLGETFARTGLAEAAR